MTAEDRGLMSNLRTILAVLALIKGIMNNKELMNSIREAVDALETAFDQLPGEFPDNLIDKIQEVIGDPTPDEEPDVSPALAEDNFEIEVE